jgi:hypothetical protein
MTKLKLFIGLDVYKEDDLGGDGRGQRGHGGTVLWRQILHFGFP